MKTPFFFFCFKGSWPSILFLYNYQYHCVLYKNNNCFAPTTREGPGKRLDQKHVHYNIYIYIYYIKLISYNT